MSDRRNDYSRSLDPTTKFATASEDQMNSLPTREDAALLARLDYEGDKDDDD